MRPMPQPAQRAEDFLDEIHRLTTDGERGAFFALHGPLISRSLVETLSGEGTALLRVDPREAEHLIGTAVWLSHRLKDDFALGRAERAFANLAHVRGDHLEALSHYQVAKDRFLTSGADVEAAITASSSLQALVFQGRHDQALREADFAKRIFEREGDRLRLARLNANYANLLHHRDRWSDAARYYEAAYKDFLEVGEKADVAVCLGNMAVCHQKRQDFAQALAFYRRTRAYCDENGLAALTADLDYNIAYLHYLRGQYTTALQLYQEARSRHSELGNRHHVDLCALDEAEIYLDLNLTGECADLARAAYSGFRDRGLNLESAKALTTLALAESRQGKPFLALELFSQAQDLFRQERNEIWVGVIDLYRAAVYARAGRPFEGRRLGESASEIFSRYSLTTKAAACRILLGRVAVDQKDWRAARNYCARALELLDQIDEPALRFQAWFLLGEAERAAGDRSQALANYLQAHEYLERVNGSVQTEEQRIPAVSDKLVIYESLVDLLAQQAPNEDEGKRAFAFVEKAKSRSLTDLLAFRAYALPSTQPGRSKLADQVRQLREELNWYYRQIDLQEMRAEDRSTSEVEALRRYSRQQENRLIRTLSLLQQTDREFSSVQEAFSVEIDALRATLPTNTSLLEYFVAKGTVFALVVDANQVRVVPTTLLSTVDELRRSLATALSKPSLNGTRTHSNQLAAILESLYDELVEPISDFLHCDRLVVVPHGALFYLPFHAFRVDDKYLCDVFTICYAPSATTYHLTCGKQQGSDSEKEPLVIFSAEDDPFASKLVTSIPSARVVDHSGQDEFKGRAYRARMIHLMTQAQLRDDNPMFSTVFFGQGPIHLFDLFQLRLDADLVTVSGWSPGLHAEGKGNEIVGLVRGLLYAGARSVLTTLWHVDEETWSAFVERFYPRVAKGDPFEVAFQSTLADLRNADSDSFQWASFVLFGDAR